MKSFLQIIMIYVGAFFINFGTDFSLFKKVEDKSSAIHNSMTTECHKCRDQKRAGSGLVIYKHKIELESTQCISSTTNPSVSSMTTGLIGYQDDGLRY